VLPHETHCNHISDDNRLVIESMLAAGASQTAVALAIGVHRSSVCRERKRGLISGCPRYFGIIAQRTRKSRRDAAANSRRKLDPAGVSPYWKLVLRYLHLDCSPQQICGRLHLMANSPTISHETIYCAIYACLAARFAPNWSSACVKATPAAFPALAGSRRCSWKCRSPCRMWHQSNAGRRVVLPERRPAERDALARHGGLRPAFVDVGQFVLVERVAANAKASA